MAGGVLEASPYHIDVKPGSTTVPRGSDQMITATIQGFESDKAELLIRKSLNTPFEHVPMVFNSDTKIFEGCSSICPARSTTSSNRAACDRTCSRCTRPTCRT